MPTQLSLDGLAVIEQKLEHLGSIDFIPLMAVWEDILKDDNLDGALNGLDGKGNKLEPVTYRPKDPAKRRKSVDYTILPFNNLTTSHYQTLSGPPLAPRREQSRIVTNFVLSHERTNSTQWAALGAWEDVLSVKGESLLKWHFLGEGRNKQRDLRGVRPSAVAKAREALGDFMKTVLGK